MQSNDLKPRSPRDRSLWIAAALAVLVAVGWELAARNSERIEFLFSRPTEVGNALVVMTVSEDLLVDTGVTAFEALIGTAAGTILGSAVGLGLALSKRAMSVATPFIGVLANFPVFALAPVAIVWLGIGMGMKVFLAALATFFVSLRLAHRGATFAQDQFAGVFDGFRASRWDTYLKLVVPGALDSVFSSMRVNVGLGILGAFIGEFIVAQRGLGRLIMRYSGLYQVDRVFAASLCIVGLALLFDQLALGLEEKKRVFARAFGVPVQLRLQSRKLARVESDKK